MIAWARRLFASIARRANRRPLGSLAIAFEQLERESNQLVEDEIRRWRTRQETTA